MNPLGRNIPPNPETAPTPPPEQAPQSPIKKAESMLAVQAQSGEIARGARPLPTTIPVELSAENFPELTDMPAGAPGVLVAGFNVVGGKGGQLRLELTEASILTQASVPEATGPNTGQRLAEAGVTTPDQLASLMKPKL